MSDLALKRQDRRNRVEARARRSPAPGGFYGRHLVRRWIRTFICGLATLILMLLARTMPAAEISEENQTKAGLLIKLAQFTDWPADAFRTTNSPAIIGIAGTDPFGGFLDKTAKDARAHGRRLEIERYHSLEEIKTCHILYIGKSEKNRLNKVLD